jgi:hypothetical protein
LFFGYLEKNLIFVCGHKLNLFAIMLFYVVIIIQMRFVSMAIKVLNHVFIFTTKEMQLRVGEQEKFFLAVMGGWI